MLESSPWVTFAKLWPTFEKCRFCAAAAAADFFFFFLRDTRDLEEKKQPNRSERRSDLRETKISGAIRVKCGPCDQPEMSDAWGMHMRADRLQRTHPRPAGTA